MQIFLLHENPGECAKALSDKHVPKLTLEAVQIANTALHLSGLSNNTFYRATHKKHPWCKFASKSFDHWLFVVRHAEALGREYLRRYDDHHKSHRKMRENWRYDDMRAIEEGMGRTDPMVVQDDLPQAIPDDYKESDVVRAYRKYYKNEKWTEPWCSYEKVPERKAPPKWFIESPRGRWKDLSG